jgi:hypothetical protein
MKAGVSLTATGMEIGAASITTIVGIVGEPAISTVIAVEAGVNGNFQSSVNHAP